MTSCMKRYLTAAFVVISMIFSLLISLIILFGGLFYFRHMEKQFADLI